jgi:hypothetical protein
VTLFRSARRRASWPGLAVPSEDHPEPMPPRPQQRQDPGPVTAPRLWTPAGHLDPAMDPCGAPHPPFKAKNSRRKGGKP